MPAPSGPLLCKVGALVELLAILDGHPVDVPLCDELAVFSVGVMRKRPGQDVEIWTQVCPVHERPASLTPGYLRSVPLARPSST